MLVPTPSPLLTKRCMSPQVTDGAPHLAVLGRLLRGLLGPGSRDQVIRGVPLLREVEGQGSKLGGRPSLEEENLREKHTSGGRQSDVHTPTYRWQLLSSSTRRAAGGARGADTQLQRPWSTRLVRDISALQQRDIVE